MADRDFNPKDGRWFYVMFEFADALSRAGLSGAEHRMLICIMRHSWPHSRPWAELRWKFIMNYTGLSGGALSKAKKRLEDRNIIKCFQKETNSITTYRINSKISTWKTVSKRKQFPKGNQVVSKRKLHPIKEKYIKNNIYSAAARKVIDKINEISGKRFRYSETSLAPIIAVMSKGFTLDDCLQVVERKWADPEFKEKYFRPITLFRASLFESYLNENGDKPKPKADKARDAVGVFARRYNERHNNQG